MASELVKFAVETLKFIFFAILGHFVLFNLGRLVLLIGTAGRYPRDRTLELHADRISFFGVFVLFCAWSALALHHNFPAAFA